MKESACFFIKKCFIWCQTHLLKYFTFDCVKKDIARAFCDFSTRNIVKEWGFFVVNCTVLNNHNRWTNSRVSKKCCIWRTQQVFVKHVQSITKNPIDDDDVIDEKIVGRTGGSLFSTPQNAIIKQVISAIKNDTFLGRSHHSLQHLHFSQIFIKTVYF